MIEWLSPPPPPPPLPTHCVLGAGRGLRIAQCWASCGYCLRGWFCFRCVHCSRPTANGPPLLALLSGGLHIVHPTFCQGPFVVMYQAVPVCKQDRVEQGSWGTLPSTLAQQHTRPRSRRACCSLIPGHGFWQPRRLNAACIMDDA